MGLLLARSLAVAFSTNSYCKSMQIKTLSYWKAVNIWEDMFYFVRFITNVPINVIQIFIFQ